MNVLISKWRTHGSTSLRHRNEEVTCMIEPNIQPSPLRFSSVGGNVFICVLIEYNGAINERGNRLRHRTRLLKVLIPRVLFLIKSRVLDDSFPYQGMGRCCGRPLLIIGMKIHSGTLYLFFQTKSSVPNDHPFSPTPRLWQDSGVRKKEWFDVVIQNFHYFWVPYNLVVQIYNSVSSQVDIVPEPLHGVYPVFRPYKLIKPSTS